MATMITDSANYSAIANAIRAKNGTENTYTPAQMADAISAITSGGGGDSEYVPAILAGARNYIITLAYKSGTSLEQNYVVSLNNDDFAVKDWCSEIIVSHLGITSNASKGFRSLSIKISNESKDFSEEICNITDSEAGSYTFSIPEDLPDDAKYLVLDSTGMPTSYYATNPITIELIYRHGALPTVLNEIEEVPNDYTSISIANEDSYQQLRAGYLKTNIEGQEVTLPDSGGEQY